MMTLLTSLTILAFAGTLGWYGHKASLRIAAWGEGMNQRDRILCGMAEAFDYPESECEGLVLSQVASKPRRSLSSAGVVASE